MRRVSFLMLLLCAVAGCHKEGPAGPFTGHWYGQDASQTITLDLTLKEAPDGGVTGSGALSGPGGSISVSVDGSEENGNCGVTLNAPPYTHANLAGPMSNGVWAAVLDGSGFVTVSVSLAKQ